MLDKAGVAPEQEQGAAPNNSFKPNPLRSGKKAAEKSCHLFASATQVGLTQVLALMVGRIAFGFLLAPALPLLPFALFADSPWATVTFVLAIAYPAALVLGPIAFLVLKRLKMLSFVPVVAASALLGAAAFATLALTTGVSTADLSALWRILLLVSGYAAMTGALFWFLALSANNSFKPNPLRGSA